MGTLTKKIGFSGLYQAAETDFDESKVDFLGEFESIFETALAHESGPWGDSLMKKTRGRKSRDAVPLTRKKLRKTA
jgi:hypothetical protein